MIDTVSFKDTIKGHDAVIVAISGRKAATTPWCGLRPTCWQRCRPASRACCGSAAPGLEVAPGVRLVDTPQFRRPTKKGARPAAALQTLARWQNQCQLDLRQPTGDDRRRRSQRQVPRRRRSAAGRQQRRRRTITWIDFAVAVVDELEKDAHPQARITVAY